MFLLSITKNKQKTIQIHILSFITDVSQCIDRQKLFFKEGQVEW
jgi:hypothetical protein